MDAQAPRAMHLQIRGLVHDRAEVTHEHQVVVEQTVERGDVAGEHRRAQLVLDREQIILADEISPDNCRLWDTTTGRKLDKDRFRQDLGNIEDAYREVARRLGVLPGQDGDSYVIQVNAKVPSAKKKKPVVRKASKPAKKKK